MEQQRDRESYLLKVTDKATDALQTARAGKKIDRAWTGFAATPRRRRRDAVKINHLDYPSSVMNCLYVAFDVSSAYRYPNASRNASNF